jgi:hypothetical protein
MKRDRSHRTKMSNFCNLHVVTSWVKIRARLLSQQQHNGPEDSQHDSLRRLLDYVKLFVRQCCHWACDTSHFHSEKGPIGTINSWILPVTSAILPSLPLCAQGVMAQALPPLHHNFFSALIPDLRLSYQRCSSAATCAVLCFPPLYTGWQ